MVQHFDSKFPHEIYVVTHQWLIFSSLFPKSTKIYGTCSKLPDLVWHGTTSHTNLQLNHCSIHQFSKTAAAGTTFKTRSWTQMSSSRLEEIHVATIQPGGRCVAGWDGEGGLRDATHSISTWWNVCLSGYSLIVVLLLCPDSNTRRRWEYVLSIQKSNKVNR